jgi:hypothetical protein
MVQRRGRDSPGCTPAHRPSRHFAAARAAPVEFSHKALFEPNGDAIAAASARAETLAREAAEAVKTADEAKKVAARPTHAVPRLTTSPVELETNNSTGRRADARDAIEHVLFFGVRAIGSLYI